MRSGWLPGIVNSSRSITVRIGFAIVARSTNSAYEYSCPSLLHALLHSWSSHNPGIFFKNRIVPATPTSFVKFAASEASLMMGSSVSTPISDHVPELM